MLPIRKNIIPTSKFDILGNDNKSYVKQTLRKQKHFTRSLIKFIMQHIIILETRESTFRKRLQSAIMLFLIRFGLMSLARFRGKIFNSFLTDIPHLTLQWIMSQNGQTTLKILQQILQDFQSVSDHFGTLCIEGLNLLRVLTMAKCMKSSQIIKHYVIMIFQLKPHSLNLPLPLPPFTNGGEGGGYGVFKILNYGSFEKISVFMGG